MATSGSVSTTTRNNRYAHLTWTQTSSGNVSTISWNVGMLGGDSTYWVVVSQCYFNVSCTKGTPSVSKVQVLSVDNSRQLKTRASIGSGSFTITHNSAAEANLTIELKVAMYYFDPTYTGTGTWALPTLYTACTAPTSVTISSSIGKPSQSLTLSWSGATSGTNNIINGYVIEYKDGTGAWASVASTTTTSTSYTVSLSPIRGTTRYWRVRTKGTAGSGYYSGFSATTPSCKVNSLPAAPTVTVNKTTVPSTGGSVTFTVTAGTDADSQTRTLYYATTLAGTKNLFTSPKALNVTSSQATYYFFTYDGLEYSGATQKSTTVNPKPTIYQITATTSTYTALNSSAWVNQITPTIAGSKTGTVTVVAEMYASEATFTKTYSFSNFALNSTSATSMGTYNLDIAAANQYLSSLGSYDIKWRLKFVLSDSLESSDAKYYPASGYYSIAKAPTVSAKFNQMTDSNISGTVAGHMYKKARLKILNDTSLTTWAVTAKVSSTTLSSSLATTISGNYRYLDVSLSTVPASGATVTFTITGSNSHLSKSVATTMVEVLAPSMGALTHGAATISPFTSTGDFNISLTNPFGTETVLATALSKYECSTTSATSIKLVNTKSSSVLKTSTVEPSIVSNTLRMTFNRATLYGWSNELGITTYAGQQSYTAKIRITNLYGAVYETPAYNCIFDFNELATIPATPLSLQYSTTSGGTFAALGTNSVQEGLYLKFTLSFSIYTKENMTFNLYNGSSIVSTVTKTAAELVGATNRTILSRTVTFTIGPIAEIKSATNISWKATVKNTKGTVTSAVLSSPVLKHTTPVFSLSKCTIANDIFSYTLTQSDTGGATGITYNLYDGSTNVSNALTVGTYTIADSGVHTWQVKSVCAKMTSVCTGLKVNTKVFYSNYIVVYKLSPTLAYRKGYVGVNTEIFNGDDAFVVSGSQGRTKVRLTKASGSIIINLADGAIDGVIIDGGSW